MFPGRAKILIIQLIEEGRYTMLDAALAMSKVRDS
jgi:hypothetical protein